MVPRSLLLLWVVTSSLLLPPCAAAQEERQAELRTLVDVEILLPRLDTSLNAQTWGPKFEKLGVPVQFRQAILDDKPALTERIRGSYRMVKAVGEMDLNGTLTFPDRTFKLSDAAALTEWINELKTYGAQGSPTGKPLWGLKREDFDSLFKDLGAPIAAEVEGQELRTALQRLGLPAKYPVRLQASAEAWLQTAGGHPLRQEVRGFSSGTGLAILLADYGLGFRPQRTPQATLELAVEPLRDMSQPWPIGWELEAKPPLNEQAPQLFDMITAGFDKLPLQDVLDAVEQASQTSIIVDYERCTARDIDPRTVEVNYPQKKTAWAILIRSVAAQARLTREVKVDEAGRVFVYVFPFVPTPAPR
jgi:hypothetical protein